MKKGLLSQSLKVRKTILSVANGLRSRKSVQERVPAIDRSGRLYTSEPRQEDEIFRVVREPVYSDGERVPGDRISDFEVALASAHLPDVTPCRNDVGCRNQRIIHPLANFVAQSVNILDRYAEDSRITVGCDGIRLRSGIVGAVIAENAAAAGSPERVVAEEEGQSVSWNAELCEQAHRDVVEKVDVDFSDPGAWAGDGVAAHCWNCNGLQRFC